MKLEDEIKQTKPFKSETQKLVLNIAFTSSWLNSIITERLKPFDLTPHQFNVMRILKGRHPQAYSNQEITERMLDKSSNSTRIVDKLISKALAERNENPVDRRLVDIRITDKGLALLEELDKLPYNHKGNITGFNEEKAKLMNEWLDELRG